MGPQEQTTALLSYQHLDDVVGEPRRYKPGHKREISLNNRCSTQPEIFENEDERNLNMNVSSNVLLLYKLQELKNSSNLNFWLAVSCLAYCGINVALIYVNYINSNAEDVERTEPPVSDMLYHGTEFWSTFVFAIVECVSLFANTGRQSVRNIYQANPTFLKWIMFFNILSTMMAATLVTMNLDEFEIISHEIEYLNELTMSFVDLALLDLWLRSNGGSTTRSPSRKRQQGEDAGTAKQQQYFTTVSMASVASAVACFQLGVYNLMGRDPETGDMVGEVLSHYCEFAFEILSSMVAFGFCMDNKLVADSEIQQILYGRCDDDHIPEKRCEREQMQGISADGLSLYGAV